MEPCVSNKKRSKRQSRKTCYDDLPKDLKMNILKRLQRKDLLRAMSVSKSWFDQILFIIFPMILFSTFPFLKLLQRVESKTKHEIPASWISVFIDTLSLHPHHPGFQQLVTWCTRVTDYKFVAYKLVDSCNGLLLFRQRSKIENNMRTIYQYYVINPVSKQCMAIMKPRPNSTPFKYVSLAYDPFESQIFKIIGFQGLRDVNVFSSKTCDWTSLRFQLPINIHKAKWLKKCVFLKGAIYRLSSSGHLIKFLIDQQEYPLQQAVAIGVPCSIPFGSCDMDIGLIHKKVVFFMLDGDQLMIWELVEHFDNGVNTLNWCQTHNVIDGFLRNIHGWGHLFAVHPYYPIAFFKWRNVIYYYFYCYKTKTSTLAKGNEGLMYRYITSAGFLMLEYSIPGRIDKKHVGEFQWLPIIGDDRKVVAYTLED